MEFSIFPLFLGVRNTNPARLFDRDATTFYWRPEMGYFHNADKYHVLDADNKPRLTGDRAEWERFRDSGRSLVARDIIGNV
jgi:hypothetical protein